VALTTSATTAIAINRTASAISTVPRPIGDCAAAGGVAGATVCTIGAEDVASELSVALLDTVDDGDDVAALSVVWLTAVAVPDVVDELADDAVDGSDDDDPADDPGAEADELGELVAVSGVAVAPEEDCSGAASPAWTEVPVASAVAFKTGTMAVAARTVRIANTAAATARVRASGRARPTAITASEHCRPHTRFVGRRSGSVSDPPPVARHRPNVAVIGRRVYAKPAPVGCAKCRKPLSPFEVGNGDAHSFVSVRRRGERPLLSYRGRMRPAQRPGEMFATAPTTGRSGVDDHGRRHFARTDWRVIHITQSKISFTRHSVGIVTRSRQRREGGAA
jgi:hypothetical protein